MKRLAAAITLAIVLCTGTTFAHTVQATGTVTPLFAPQDDVEGAIVSEIDAARAEVLVQAYSFTSKAIAKAVVNAHKRGVKVLVVLDKSQRTEKYSAADFLANAGIETAIDDSHPIAHNKIVILDRATLIGGSYNYSSRARQNAENAMIFKNNPQLIELYVANFFDHKSHSVPYASRGKGGALNHLPGILGKLAR